jgi:hypothetical protein
MNDFFNRVATLNSPTGCKVEAGVVLDSLFPSNTRVTTIALRYPRFVHSEFMTHRQFSRNASSSRAIPVEKMLDQVMNDPAIPARWGRNARGMQDGGELLPVDQEYCLEKWLEARDHAVMVAKDLLRMPEQPHKQVVNRLLEPWQYIKVLVTSTTYSNFIHLRDHKDADPTMQLVGGCIRSLMDSSIPQILQTGDWHLPYIQEEDIEDLAVGTLNREEHQEKLLKVSSARCARVSYLNFQQKRSKPEEDLELFEKLHTDPLHASALEHPCKGDRLIFGHWQSPELHGNFEGCIQYRKLFANECYWKTYHVPYKERIDRG